VEDKSAPRPGCICEVCIWDNRKLAEQARLEADLTANYERYLNGDLVSRSGKE